MSSWYMETYGGARRNKTYISKLDEEFLEVVLAGVLNVTDKELTLATLATATGLFDHRHADLDVLPVEVLAVELSDGTLRHLWVVVGDGGLPLGLAGILSLIHI